LAWRTQAALAAIFVLGVNLAPQGARAASSVGGDVVADPAVRLGVLPNGLRYAIRRNGVPQAGLSVRLAIETGSMQEAPAEQGVAHLIEHMAFRGSQSFADGEMMQALQRLGARPGADANAETDGRSTSFQFDVARSDPEALDQVLAILRDITGRLTFSPTSLAAERQVVLAEARGRAGPGAEVGAVLRRFEFGAHPMARSTTARSEIVATATPTLLRRFYDAFYRPERAIVVIVGDVDPGIVESALRKAFADFAGRGPAGRDPQPVADDPGGAAIQVAKLDGVSGSSLYLLWPEPLDPGDDLPHRRRAILEALAGRIIDRRFADAAPGAERPFLTGGLYAVGEIGVARARAIELSQVTDPVSAISAAVGVLRQVGKFGVTQAEVDAVVANRRAALQADVASAGARSNTQLADDLVSAALDHAVFTTPQQRLAVFESAVTGLTPRQISEALQPMISRAPPHLLLVEPARAAVEGERLGQALAMAERAPAHAVTDRTPTGWKPPDFGRPGRVAEDRRVDDLGVRLVRFANGVRLTVKSTTYAPGQVSIRVRFGHGLLDRPSSGPTAAWLATEVLASGGLAEMSIEDLARALRGTSLSAYATTDPDAFVLRPVMSSMPAADFDREMALLAELATEPGWRPDLWAPLQATAVASESRARASARGVLTRDLGVLLHGGDTRWSWADAAQARTWTPAEARAFLQPILATSPFEIVVVGDVTPDAAIAGVAHTFGALPPRPERVEPPGLRSVAFPPPTARPITLHHRGPVDQAAYLVAWPATGLFADPREAAAATVLAEIFRERVSDALRSGLGITYTPQAAAAFAADLPSYGQITVRIEAKPQDIPKVASTIDIEAEALRANAPSADEFGRVAKPRVEGLRRMMQLNATWLSALAGAQLDPRRLDYLRTFVSDTETLQPDDIVKSARRWLDPARRWRLQVTPESTGMVKAEAPPQPD